MIVTREETIAVTDYFICDSCGLMIQTEGECMNLKAFWGYFSKHDDELWEAQICENCVITKLEPIIKFNKEHI